VERSPDGGANAGSDSDAPPRDRGLRALFSNVLQAGLVAGEVHPATLIRVRTVNAAMITMVAIAVPFMVRYGALGVPHMVAALAICVVGALGNMWLLRRTHRPTAAGYVASGLLLALLVASNVTSGGFYEPNFAWLYVVPLVALIVADLRAAWMLTGIVLVTAVVFWFLPRWGVHLVSVIPVEEQEGQALANRLSAILAVGVLTWLFVRQQHRTESALRVAREELEEESVRVAQLSNFDGLTGLPNRQRFHDDLNEALASALDQGRTVSLLFFDLDRFKDVNDTLGHNAGDELLQMVGERLVQALRPEDAMTHELPRELRRAVSRLGGDEFTVMLRGVKGSDDVGLVADRLLTNLREPFLIGDQEIFVTASVGIAMAPDDGERVEQLLMYADAAMYAAKSGGGDTYRFFSKHMSADHEKRLVIGSRLRRALESPDGFRLVYQPIVCGRTSRVLGLEALIRWRGDDGIVVAPSDFVPIAEATGIAPRLDSWVLARALRDLKVLQERGHDRLKMAVNISAKHVRDPQLVERVMQLVTASGIDPASIELEITESALVSHDGVATDNLRRLDEAGIGVALDDFGTGYSSLSHLRAFPVSKLKIDRSFVANAVDDEADTKLCAAIAALGTGLGLDVVAEGVETPEQALLLRELGCSHLQGYHFARPMELSALLEHLGGLRVVTSADVG